MQIVNAVNLPRMVNPGHVHVQVAGDHSCKIQVDDHLRKAGMRDALSSSFPMMDWK